MIVRIVILGAFLLCHLMSQAQSILFAANPHRVSWLDPTHYVAMEKSGLIGVEYQNQYTQDQLSKWETLSLYGHYKWDINQKDAVGLQGYTVRDKDRIGVRSLHMQLGGSYMKTLSQPRALWNHRGMIGAQIGLVHLQSDQGAYWFSSQYDVEREVVDRNLVSGERFEDELISSWSWPLHIGIGYLASYQDLKIEAHASMRNINRPIIRADSTMFNLERLLHSTISIEYPWHERVSHTSWFSFAQQDYSKLLAWGNSVSLTEGSYEDWKLSIGFVLQMATQNEAWTLRQLGTIISIQWNQTTIRGSFYLPTIGASPIGSSFTLGVEQLLQSRY